MLSSPSFHQSLTDLMNRYGVFFAFSKDQFREFSQPGVDYTSPGIGMYVPRQNEETFNTSYEALIADAIQKHLAEKSKEEIICDELRDKDCIYDFSVEAAMPILSLYGFSRKDVQQQLDILIAGTDF